MKVIFLHGKFLPYSGDIDGKSDHHQFCLEVSQELFLCACKNSDLLLQRQSVSGTFLRCAPDFMHFLIISLAALEDNKGSIQFILFAQA